MRELWTKQRTAEAVGLSPVHLMRLVHAGQFPAPIRIGDPPRGAIRFVADEIDAWLSVKLKERA